MVRAASSSTAQNGGDASQHAPVPGTELDPRAVFEPLRLACATRSTNLVVISLDCLGKLVSYSFFAEDVPSNPNEEALADVVTSTVCDAFYDGLDDRAQLQIIKALLGVVLSNSVHVHQSSLLKAVRTVYNIFLLSKSASTQAVAQGVLTQMVHHVFGRVPTRKSAANEEEGNNSMSSSSSSSSVSGLAGGGGFLGPPQTQKAGSKKLGAPEEEADGRETTSEAEANDRAGKAKGEEEGQEDVPLDDDNDNEGRDPNKSGAASQEGNGQIIGADGKPLNGRHAEKAQPPPPPPAEKVTLRTLESRASFEGASEKDTGAKLMAQSQMSQAELFVKDAFLVLRALCKLSMKPLGTESERDLKSHAMRSKLLSLHLILTILKSHQAIFTDSSVVIQSATTGEQTPFVQAVKQYLCLSLSRNAVSSVNQVFEISCEIFWLVLSGMRTKLKKEIEVLLNEIFLPILEMRNSTARQKSILLGVLVRLCQDPQALVEIYINYDCDRTALDNIYERLMNVISKISQTHIMPGSATTSRDAGDSLASSSVGAGSAGTASARMSTSSRPSIPPTLSTASASEVGVQELSPNVPGQTVEARLKRQSLDCLCSVLRSLVLWSNKAAASSAGPTGAEDAAGPSSPRFSEDYRSSSGPSAESSVPMERSPSLKQATTLDGVSTSETSRVATPDPSSSSSSSTMGGDDPSRFESAKQRKTTLLEGIKTFNFKPKRGIDDLVRHGFIPSREPGNVARFLLYADGLNKAQIGEYLGEGDASNIAIMHAFVDLMNFERMPFTDALRRFLQAFRLPGEAQKIDRFMLKFAERYVAGNPNAFANADTAYVLAYSVIMLNTDAHSPQVKHRMTLQDFIKNNSGIDDGKSLPDDFIKAVFDEIQNHEIKMKDEALTAAVNATAGGQGAGLGLANAIAAVGRDLQREAYVLQSEGMANRTEALFRTMVRAQRRVHPQQRAAAEQFFSASHFEHVRPMFEVAWMAFLAGISGPMQESDDADTVAACLEGFKDAIRIVCLFGLELERNAFVTTLAKFTFLNNLGEMKSKNVEAIKTLLGVAQTEGNYLKGSWRELLTCVSQLERFQLISGGVDQRQLPELGRRKPSTTSSSSAKDAAAAARTAMPTEEVVQAGASSEVTVAADMVFSSTPHLSGTAIVEFVQSLSDVSWEEIQSSGMSETHPRLFSLQKLVEISYYNMSRIRMEWSNIWSILGEHFNQVCIHPNPRVSAFGLDSLRQLSVRFLEKEELSHFKFQKDFLKPFEYTMRNNPSSEAKEMVLQCLQQMIASRIVNMRSGWRTLFGTFGAASRSTERVASYAFEIVKQLNQDHLGDIIQHGAFADLTVCLTDFAKATHAQRLALQSVSMLRGVVPAMLAASECPLDEDTEPGPAASTPMTDDPMVRFWFPALFAFYDIIMNGDDLEVRRVALDALFEILKRHGQSFRPDFWDTVCQEVLFPIFAVLRSRSDVTRFSTQEDMSVWLSTTMIQALRNLIDLWTFYFETLDRLLPGLLDLLCACICQENDTLARIGTSCLQQLLEKNVSKLNDKRWTQVVDTFVQLFRTTTAHQLFDPALRAEQVAISPRNSRSDSISGGSSALKVGSGGMTTQPLSPGMSPTAVEEANSAAQEEVDSPPLMTQTERRRAFKQIIVKCVLQLLLIETTDELLQKSASFYELMPPVQLLRLTQVLEDSFRFSRKFNADKDLRTALWKVGFMRQLPNLLKQESSSASTLVHVLIRMHSDASESRDGPLRGQIRERLVPLAQDIINAYLPLDTETQARNIAAWTPVVAEVFVGLCDFDKEQEQKVFKEYLGTFYPLAVDVLHKRQADPGSSASAANAAAGGKGGEPLLGALQRFFEMVGYEMGLMTVEGEAARKRKVWESRQREKVDRADRVIEAAPVATPVKANGAVNGMTDAETANEEEEEEGSGRVSSPQDLKLELPPPVQQNIETEQNAAALLTPSHAPTPPVISDEQNGEELA